MNKDADAAELKMKVRTLERQLEQQAAFKERQGVDSEEKESIVVGTMARGLAKENERLLKEIASLKNTLAEWKAQKTAASKGNLDVAAEEVHELRNVVQRLQDDLLKKDEFYRKREDSNKAKLMLFDSLEAACKQKDKEIGMLKDDYSDLKNKVLAGDLRIGTLEGKIKNLQTENKELSDQVFALKKDNQE